MERKIGEVFECNGVRLKVVEADECDKCYFAYKRKYGACTRGKYISISGFCSEANREDRKSVQFIEIKNEKMKEETKSLPIPEGWEFAGYENGEVRIRKVEPELPTDFEKALGAVKVSEIRSMLVPSGMYGAVSALCKLLIYRNAWWQKGGSRIGKSMTANLLFGQIMTMWNARQMQLQIGFLLSPLRKSATSLRKHSRT